MGMQRHTSAYSPKGFRETRTAVQLLIPTAGTYHGVSNPTYPATGDVIFVNWKSFGGTETTVDGVYSIIDTAYVTCRYRPDIRCDCRLKRSDGAVYQIKGEPENIDMENRILAFRVERVKGGA